ncbi:MAG: hypothetical protein MUE82_10170, partial [Chloroflexi bacterium]|nr:hypothetical protein [Chloroflexota bacterium]
MDLRRMRKKAKGRGKKAAREEGATPLADTRDPVPQPGPAADVTTAAVAAARAPDAAPAPPDAPDDAELREREEIAETLYRAAVSRAEVAEAMYKAAVTR